MSLFIAGVPSFDILRSVANSQTSSLPTIKPQTDTIRLSDSAQARLLKQQGDNTTTIAQTLGITISTVDSLLHIDLTQNSASIGINAFIPKA